MERCVKNRSRPIVTPKLDLMLDLKYTSGVYFKPPSLQVIIGSYKKGLQYTDRKLREQYTKLEENRLMAKYLLNKAKRIK